MRTSFKYLSQLPQNNNTVICKANKEGKIIIVDYKACQNIIEAKLQQFEILNYWNIVNKSAEFGVSMEECYNKCLNFLA